MSEWLKTNWVCPLCGGKLYITPLYRLKLSIKCDKCHQQYESDVDLHIPFNSQSIRHKDRPKYTLREQYA